MTLLLLAGTGGAREIAEALKDSGIQTIASLAGGGRGTADLAVPTRVGGFGGEAGFRDFLTSQQITAVLDATHPFADRISRRTAQICAEESLPYCQFLRPAWVPGAGDNWVLLNREEEAAEHIPEGATVFLATGRSTLERFANLGGRQLIVRRIDAPEGEFPLPDGEFLIGTPPFTVEEERALFQDLAVDWLIVKNAGGDAPRPKLIAARQLGLPVVVLARPSPAGGALVETVDQALAWVEGL